MSQSFSLRDKYAARNRSILLTGVQSLVRLMLLQAESDQARGLRTAGFVSGYRGSPLGTVDFAFDTAKDLTGASGIVVKPAINEEMAATAIAGSQQIDRTPSPNVDGVFALWYGKGPGLDRALDAVRHGNTQGSSPNGGVVLAIGDDHLAKSSTLTCYSDTAAAALVLPLFYPADAWDIIHFGLHGFALSRLSGSWVGMKIVPDVADSTFSVSPHPVPHPVSIPELRIPEIGLHSHWPETPVVRETRQQEYRLPAVAAYMAANPLDRILYRGPSSRIGFVAAGKSWNDLLEALRLLALAPEELERLGVALFKPAMVWPVQNAAVEFALGLDELIVVEEKGPFIEDQLRSALYGKRDAPAIYGKAGPNRSALFKAVGDLSPELIASGLGAILARHREGSDIAATLTRLQPIVVSPPPEKTPPLIRKPFFCSGCPHNRSTVVPEGSRALAGIGCHGLAAYNRPRTDEFSQMGGEGVHWVGLAPFTDERHVFANIGDGTYFHSGLLAIRQAVAAKVNITYKLLYNSAVAMTGGQPIDGELSVEQVAAQLRAEGVRAIVIVSDDSSRYSRNAPVRSIVDRIEHRDDMEALQLELRETKGVSVIIYEQMCATERRRQRKRGRLPEPSGRVFINELVCEGCGDCSAKSNCLSVEPVETHFGTKRRINQSSCNKDYSCLNGFCPSFVRIEGSKPKAAKVVIATAESFPKPPSPQRNHERIIVAGVGGTGVVTIGALLATAAHLGNAKVGVLDQVGMAQKGGAVASHIHIEHGAQGEITALRLPARQADIMIACDGIVAISQDVFATIDPGRTWVLANADVSITGDFTQDPEAVPDGRLLSERLRRRAGDDHFEAFPFARLAERLVGDAIGANLMMVGFAYQRGWIGLDDTRLMSAIEVNGQAVELNKAAFNFGRKLACDKEAVYREAGIHSGEPESLDATIQRFAGHLTDYQNEPYAERFLTRIKAVAEAERRVSTGNALTEAATRSLFKLMAYKDEYEVARLYTDGNFLKSVAAEFEDNTRLSFYMAPPILARRDPATGHARKRSFGPWMFQVLRILASLKGLRSTAFDPFGLTAERKLERQLVREFDSWLQTISAELSAETLGWAVEIAKLPLDIRGYGHVKAAAVDTYYTKLRALLAATPDHMTHPNSNGSRAEQEVTKQQEI